MKKIGLITFFLLIISATITGCGTSNFCKTDTLIAAQEQARIEFNDQTGNYPTWIAKNPAGSLDEYIKAYQKSYSAEIYKRLDPKTCIVTEDVKDPTIDKSNPDFVVHKKTWGDALGRGLIEMALIFPISLLLLGFSSLIKINGLAQILAIFMTTFIIRGLTLVLSYKSTLQQQKVQEIQPEIAKINAKYANKNDPQTRQLIASETMALYTKYKVNPIGMFIPILWQFPIFIGMYAAIRETYELHHNQILGFNLGKVVSAYLNVNNFNFFVLGIFVLVAITQFISSKLTGWLTANDKKKSKHYVKEVVLTPQAKAQQKQMNIMMYFFLGITVFFAYTLPVAMSLYWIANSIVAIVNIFVTRKINKRHKKADKAIKEDVYDADL
jgi:YidC/Oxa1 family membrane protein insertase